METAPRLKPRTRRRPPKKAALCAVAYSFFLRNIPVVMTPRASTLEARVRDYNRLALKGHDLRRTQQRVGKFDVFSGFFAGHREQTCREWFFQANGEGCHVPNHARELLWRCIARNGY